MSAGTIWTTGFLCRICLQLTADRDMQPCDPCRERMFRSYMQEAGER